MADVFVIFGNSKQNIPFLWMRMNRWWPLCSLPCPQDVCFLPWQCVPLRIYLVAWPTIATVHIAGGSSHAGARCRRHTSWISIFEGSGRVPFALCAYSYCQNLLQRQSQLVGSNHDGWTATIRSLAGNVTRCLKVIANSNETHNKISSQYLT